MARGLELNESPRVFPALLTTMAAVLVVVAGCREAPPQAPKTVVADPMARTREAMDRRDYDGAIGLLRAMRDQHPTDLEVHYRLAVSASHLDQLDEASREFEWVVAHGQSGAPEVQISRDWLASSRPHMNVPAPSPVSAGDEAQAQKAELASLSGKAVGPDKPMARLQLLLKGIPGTGVKSEFHPVRTDQEGAFHFANVVPGEYMLTNALAGPVRWRLRIALAPSEHRVLDLSPANDATVRDDFPESR